MRPKIGDEAGKWKRGDVTRYLGTTSRQDPEVIHAGSIGWWRTVPLLLDRHQNTFCVFLPVNLLGGHAGQGSISFCDSSVWYYSRLCH